MFRLMDQVLFEWRHASSYKGHNVGFAGQMVLEWACNRQQIQFRMRSVHILRPGSGEPNVVCKASSSSSLWRKVGTFIKQAFYRNPLYDLSGSIEVGQTRVYSEWIWKACTDDYPGQDRDRGESHAKATITQESLGIHVFMVVWHLLRIPRCTIHSPKPPHPIISGSPRILFR
ncbi:hypothetical protein FA15DRAFT_211998 [Coprinopsis marcescibilis]|uniref:Uncharacterized protein n=1 Tax=Coprinopsis marcescibilis TaxID=230819 RepID=A0A5C3L3I5_COPMA|nr:hypothetical protein FA15DRAFT_211998 [Coprinopsis marcescibilis]